jgi:hypothetical protein
LQPVHYLSVTSPKEDLNLKQPDTDFDSISRESTRNIEQSRANDNDNDLDIEEEDEIEEYVEDGGDNDDVVSEGGDDFHCTQLAQDGDDFEIEITNAHDNDKDDNGKNINQISTKSQDINDDDQTKKYPSTLTIRSSSSTAKSNNNNDDICFICGKSLIGVKRRVEHIKRCTKKFGISGWDVRREEDDLHNVNHEDNDATADKSVTGRVIDESLIVTATSNTITVSVTCDNANANTKTTAHSPPQKTIINPYSPSKKHNDHNDWHGDSRTLLNIASNGSKIVATNLASMTPSTKSMVQVSIAKTFQPQPRNALNVLLAGARKQSKEEAVFKKRAAAVAEGKGSENGSRNGSLTNKRGRWGQQQQCISNKSRRSTSIPAYKKITGTDFVVDGFFYGHPSLTNNYFLTHFHSDHYGGITSNWNAGTIYCSLTTATLVYEQLKVDKKYLHPLPIMTPTVIETNKGKNNHKPVTVTLLDANHCPGAVMFLFEIPSANGRQCQTTRILHVGDFRWNRSFMLEQPPLASLVKNDIVLDELYLDTTYCNPKYELPTQQDAIEAIVSIFEQEQNRQKERGQGKTLHLFGSYTIGKEKMYLVRGCVVCSDLFCLLLTFSIHL